MSEQSYDALIPWMERVNMFQVNPEAAEIYHIKRMAEELSSRNPALLPAEVEAIEFSAQMLESLPSISAKQMGGLLRSILARHGAGGREGM